MNNKIVIFCFSASPVIGSGHSVRCYALAQEFIKTGWKVKYILGEETVSTVPYLFGSTDSVFSTYESTEELPAILSKVDICDLLILDDYSFNHDIENSCRKYVKKIAVIEDIPSRKHDCDYLIDQTPGRNPKDYDELVPENTIKLVGGKYVLLRKEFLSLRNEVYKRKEKGKNKKAILISYGSLDEHDLICKTIDIIMNKNIDMSINIIISSASASLNKIKKYKDKYANIELFVDVRNVAEFISDSDLAIGAAGLSSLERCCLGVPSLIIETSDNQKQLAKGLEKINSAIYLGKFSEIDWEKTGETIKNIIQNNSVLENMSSISMAQVDGHGAMRVILAILPGHHSKNKSLVSLRLAEYSDMSKIYDWQVQPSTRKFSKNRNAPTLEEHKNWFYKNMNSTKCVQTIIQSDSRDVGVLRFDQNEERTDDYVLSIYLDPAEYGKGIGYKALLCGRELFPNKKFIAEIMDENEASRRIFSKAGYNPISSGVYESLPLNQVV